VLKSDQFVEYLNRISTGPTPSISPTTADKAKAMWKAIAAVANSVSVPAAYVLEYDRLCCTWGDGKHHLEVIISPDLVEWYGSDGTFDGAWAEDFAEPEKLPVQAVAYLQQFLATGKS
jgi:hypothetical protein